VNAAWPSKALAEVCEIKPPKSEAKRTLKDSDLVSFVPMEDLGIDQKFLEQKSERKLGQVAGSYTYFADGDVLLAKITPCFENGKLSIAKGLRNGIGFGSSEYIVFRPSNELSNEYLYYFLLQESFRLDGIKTMSGAVGHKRVSKEFIERYRIPLPPLSEQQRIVAILDEAFAGLLKATENAEKNLKNARDLFESYLNSVFSTGECPSTALAEVCSISSRLVDPRKPPFIDLPHLGAGNMASKTGALSDIKTAREEGLKSGKFLFDSTMVLYSKIRPYLMKACRPDFKGLCSADVYPLSPNSGQLDRNFLFHLLMSKDFTDFAISGSDRAGMPKVNREHLFKYSFKLPSIGEQVLLARKLDKLAIESNRLATFYERKLVDFAALKQSILQKAFYGELSNTATQAVVQSTPGIADMRRETALVIALAYERHKRNKRDKSFGHTKEQKILHMVEAVAEFDLGRQPTRDAAGPNDFHHMLAAEEWAETNKYFRISERASGGYQFQPLRQYYELLASAKSLDQVVRNNIDRVIDVFIDMNMQEAEVFATVYAAWNNLLIEGKTPTDDEIVRAAREDWHPDKLKISRAKFVEGLRQVRQKNFKPKGQGRFVAALAQSRLPL
jgi:type I restriction enzyme S subunit